MTYLVSTNTEDINAAIGQMRTDHELLDLKTAFQAIADELAVVAELYDTVLKPPTTPASKERDIFFPTLCNRANLVPCINRANIQSFKNI